MSIKIKFQNKSYSCTKNRFLNNLDLTLNIHEQYQMNIHEQYQTSRIFQLSKFNLEIIWEIF